MSWVTVVHHSAAEPFRHGLTIAFGVSIAMLLIAAVAWLMRSERFAHSESEVPAQVERRSSEETPRACGCVRKMGLSAVGGDRDLGLTDQGA